MEVYLFFKQVDMKVVNILGIDVFFFNKEMIYSVEIVSTF